jgi:hypothetical protein
VRLKALVAGVPDGYYASLSQYSERSRRPSYKRARRHPATYNSWRTMIARCYSPADAGYANYGARGIRVCDRWRSSFEAFVADMGERPAGRSLDRIDNDGDYEPSNCRWATRGEQTANRRCAKA